MAWIKKTTIISLSICIKAPCLSPCLCLVNKWTIVYTYSRETDRPTCVEHISASRDATEACHISKDAAGNSSELWFSKDLAQSSFWCLESIFLRSFFRQKRRMIGRLASFVSRLPGKLLMLVISRNLQQTTLQRLCLAKIWLRVRFHV